MTTGAICSSAWFAGAFVPELADLNNGEDDEVDSCLILDQDAPVAGILGDGYLLQQLPLQQDLDVNISSGALNRWMNEPACTTPGSSPQQDEEGRSRGSTVAKQGSKGGRKCTSLAQREAHKRYREKKKQSIAAMEQAVQAKQYELEQLQAENEQLKSRARVLETAERCSVEIHELMKLLDGLQSLPQEDVEEVTDADKGGSSCTSSLVKNDGSNMAAAATAAAAAASGHRSSTDNSSQEALPFMPACAYGDASAAVADGSVQQSSFLQDLLCSPMQQVPGVEPYVMQEQQQGNAHASTTARLSLQHEDHWLQMAQRYLEVPQQQQQQQQQQQSCSQGAAADTEPSAAAGASAGCAAEPTGQAGQACSSLSAGGALPSSTAESGSSVLAELGSVDTAEQGLVIYKSFLHKASEMLALAQQQQQQGDLDAAATTERELGQLTRSTIGRLQPFLVARGQGVVYDWNARNLDTQQPEEPPSSLWSAVLDALQLTADTQRDALQCFDLFSAPLTRLLEHRAQLAQQYRLLQSSAVNTGSSSGNCSAPDDGGDAAVSVNSAKTLESVAGHLVTSGVLLRALAANLERYQSLDGVFAHSLTTLLTGAQIAAACVASYPYLPRWHSMMAALKQRREEETQRQVQDAQGQHSEQPQRRSSRVRVATQAAKEAYL